MSSIRRISASRANGARSQGPVTQAGLQRSSQNATSHGLLSNCVVLESESQEAFDALMAQLIERFQPADGIELATVEEMAASLWRIRRAWAIETRMLDNHTAAQPEGDLLDRITAAFTEPNHVLGQTLMHRYETRLHLMYQRAFHNFLILRQEIPNSRIPNEPSPISGHQPRIEPPETGQLSAQPEFSDSDLKNL